jgi:hypothetical protein
MRNVDIYSEYEGFAPTYNEIIKENVKCSCIIFKQGRKNVHN